MVCVLIVDDEPKLLRTLADFLLASPGDFSVLTAASGEEAMVALDSEAEVDVLLTDVRMPGIDGIELVRRAMMVRPELGIVVMTAFSSPDMRSHALTEGAMRFIDKPLDLETLRSTLKEVHDDPSRRSRLVGGLTVAEVIQFVHMAGETKVLSIRGTGSVGTVVIDAGELVHAATGKKRGMDALAVMLDWGAVSFSEVFRVRPNRYTRSIRIDTSEFLRDPVAVARHHLESSPAQPPTEITESRRQQTSPAQTQLAGARQGKESRNMAIKDHLNEFQGIEGFMGAAVFSSQGEMLDSKTAANIDVKSIGMYANNALLNAQKATDQMGVGRGNLMQIRAPQATVIMRCLNEATDFAATADGKAHFHTIVLMSPEGNVGMATMILDKVVARIADEVR